jgi:hypothetical protein
MEIPEATGSQTPVGSPTAPPTTTTPALTEEHDLSQELSETQRATLESLTQVDGYPLYTMTYYGEYGPQPTVRTAAEPWACSLFAALGDTEQMVYGRNFDWHFSPALLLFTDPVDGYASVSMVDIAYMGFTHENVHGLTDLPLVDRAALLGAPFLPFDGMNEAGLAIGFAAVRPGGMEPDPDKETIGSLEVVRTILDQASDVDEALAIFERYNIDMAGGPPLHYLIADRSGRSVLIEFTQGEMVVLANDGAWQAATNFIRARAGEDDTEWCWRYDRISRHLSETEGRLTMEGAIDLLGDVAQAHTQWSIAYGISSGQLRVSMGREQETLHTFDLDRR